MWFKEGNSYIEIAESSIQFTSAMFIPKILMSHRKQLVSASCETRTFAEF